MVTMQAGDLSSAPGTLQPFHPITPSPHTGLWTAAKQKKEMGKGTKMPAQGTVAGAQELQPRPWEPASKPLPPRSHHFPQEPPAPLLGK